MKYNKMFRILAVAIILSLLMLAIPASPALAAVESIDLSPDRGEIGDKIRVRGEDFDASAPDDRVKVYIYFSSQEAERRGEIDDDVTAYEKVDTDTVGYVGERDEGEFSTYFYVPEELTDGDDEEDVHSGTYYVYVTYSDSDRIEAVAEFTIRGIELDPDEGVVGTEVEITGIGFDDKEGITIEYDDEDVDIDSGDEKTDSDGEFTCTIIIPESSAGDHTIAVMVYRDEVEASFTVEPEITISPTSGSPATEVTISGTGFIASKSITITFNDTMVTTSPASVKSNGDGSFSNVKFNVPTLVSGTYKVEASDGINEDALNFTISIAASLSPTTGNVGTALTVSGTGFVANRTVIINYDAAEVATATVEANGAFSVTFNAPTSQYGDHIIIATDLTNTRQFTFTMESTPPLTPVPLLPETGVKAESPVYFDWEDVTDDSLPVTYTLQIATDKDFTSIVLEKKGLTKSEYTITEAEKLPSTKKEAPYYWRVKAIDGASNVSEWTGTGSFYIGFVFELAGWILYTLMGVGGLLLLALGYWLGRRTAYSSF